MGGGHAGAAAKSVRVVLVRAVDTDSRRGDVDRRFTEVTELSQSINSVGLNSLFSDIVPTLHEKHYEQLDSLTTFFDNELTCSGFERQSGSSEAVGLADRLLSGWSQSRCD